MLASIDMASERTAADRFALLLRLLDISDGVPTRLPRWALDSGTATTADMAYRVSNGLRSAIGLDWQADGQGRAAPPIAKHRARARCLRTISVAVDVESTNSPAYSELPDEELLRLIDARDHAAQAAFAALYDRHAGLVGGICLRRLRNPEVAAEITQDVFAQIWNGASRFEPGRAKFTTWLFTIVRNRCIDSMRKVERAPLSEQFEDSFADTKAADPETAAHSEQCRRRLVDALSSLPDAQREAVRLCVIEGYTHTEAAERLGEALGTVKSRVKLGLEKLKSKMAFSRQDL